MENEAQAIILPRTEDLEYWLFLLVIVIILLLSDVVKAYCMRRAFWFPGQALVLSALIFQLLSFVDYSNISVYSGSSYETKEVSAILVKNQLVIDSGRLMMYVLIAYLLPGMARSGSISDASTLAVLALTITIQVVSEVRSHWKVEKRNESLSALAASSEGFGRIISYLCSTILISAIIYLLWLLMRAIMVGRSIRRIMSQKIRAALSCCTPGHVLGCDQTKDHVLKCWIVVRLSQPDYVLARSGFCSMVCRMVTACIVLHVINWTHVQFTDNESLNSVTQRKLVLFVIFGQFVIVLIGWIVLFVRGVTSAMHRDISSGDYFKSVSIEDALTDLAASFIPYFYKDKRIQEQKIRHFYSSLSGFKTRVIESVPGICVQKLFQLFSGHWVQTLFQFFTPWFVSIAGHNDGQFDMYKETLKKLRIGGESELSLWKANQQGLSRVKGKMEQGQQAGEDSPSELTDLLGEADKETDRERLEQLQQRNNNSWKRTAVSLIHLMINSYENSHASVIEKAMKCYIQAWEYMHFVDGLNEEDKSLDWQTDEEFESLQHTWNNRAEDGMLETKINAPLNELKRRFDLERNDLQNSRDPTEVAKYCLLQTWTLIHPDLTAAGNNKIDWLQRILANVSFFCMTEVLNKAVLEKCCKLAEEGMEEEILDVAFLAAKAQAVREEVREGHNTDPASTSSHIPTVSEQVGEGHNTDQASTSSHILTVSEQVGDGNGQAELAVVGEGNDQENPVEPRDNTKVSEGNGQAELLPGRLLRRVGSAPFGKGNGQAGLPRVDIRFHSGDRNVIERHGRIHGNPIIFGDNSIRSRRPNDSLTDQTEIAVAPKDDKPKDE